MQTENLLATWTTRCVLRGHCGGDAVAWTIRRSEASYSMATYMHAAARRYIARLFSSLVPAVERKIECSAYDCVMQNRVFVILLGARAVVLMS